MGTHYLLLVLLTGPLGSGNHVDERSLDLGPGTSLESTVGVDDDVLCLGDGLEDGGNLLLELLLRGNTRRVDVVGTGSNYGGGTRSVSERGEERRGTHWSWGNRHA
jgi:hypothetical protein